MNSDFYIAVHALVYLTHIHGKASSDELAENMCTSAVRVRRVLSQLKKAGLVETREGKQGGYHIAGDEEKINLCMIVDALHLELFSFAWPHDMNQNCLIASGMGEIMSSMYEEMEERCRAYLADKRIIDLVHTLEEKGNH